MPEEKEPTEDTVDTCPSCGETETMFNDVAKGARTRKLLKPEDTVALGEFSLTVVNPEILQTLIIGSKVPYITCAVDACSKCKLLRVTRFMVTESPVTTQPVMGIRKPRGPFSGFFPPGGIG